MRSSTSRLAGFAVATWLGLWAAIGCSASGDSGSPAADQNPTDPGQHWRPGPGSGISNPDNTSVVDSGKEGGLAGQLGPRPAPKEGDPCPTPNKPVKRSCGMCGWQSAMCLKNDSGNGGTIGKFDAECLDEILDGCKPGETEEIACGNCGKQTRTCNDVCRWTSPSCLQPPGACTPGAVQMNPSGCPLGQFHTRSCTVSCAWEDFSGVCTPAPTFVKVAPTIQSINSTVVLLSGEQVATRLPSATTATACPLGASWPGQLPETPYAYIEVRNPLPKAVIVSVYTSAAQSGPPVDTILAAYDGATAPSSEDERRACKGHVLGWGNKDLTIDTKFASLDGAKAVSIGPNASVQIYVGGEVPYDTAVPQSVGLVKLSVRTDSIAP